MHHVDVLHRGFRVFGSTSCDKSEREMIRLDDLKFRYPSSNYQISIPELIIKSEASAAVVGPSGSGKTTLLHLMAGILKPTSGALQVGDVMLSSLNESARRDFRIRKVGMVFQEFELIEYLTVLDNVLLPFRINPIQSVSDTARRRAIELLSSVGLKDHHARSVTRLSQGERQRVAICRALVAEPSLLLADEPTGNLDPDTSRQIVDLLLTAVRDRGMTLLMVTHDHSLLNRFDRVIDFQQFFQDADRNESEVSAS